MLLVPQPLQQFTIMLGIGMTRSLRQGAVILRDGLFQLAGAGQGVAPVVGGLRTRLVLQGLQGLVIGAGLILSGGAPVRTLKAFRGLAGFAGGQGLGTLLVGPPPEILPAQGLRRRRWWR